MEGRSAADLSANISDTVDHSRDLSLMVIEVYNVRKDKKAPCVGVLGMTNTKCPNVGGGDKIGRQTDRTMAGFE